MSEPAALIPTKINILGSVVIGLVLVAGISTFSGCGETKTEGKSKSAKKEKTSNKATDDNEPHVGPKGSVIVDTLRWRILSAKTAPSVGNEYSREKADGIYVIAELAVHNGKNESVTINSDIVELEVGDAQYKYDSDGTVALTLTGDNETFFLKDLGPDVSTKGVVAFDVPPRTLRKKPELCFHELGFGSTKGCIRVPSL